jgi:Family of unknown function (DUF6461)
MSRLAHYRELLAAEPQFASGSCVTWAVPAEPDAALARMARAVAPGETAAYATAVEQAAALTPFTKLVLVDSTGGWAMLVEPFGHQGNRPEVLRAASSGGRAICVWWDAGGHCQISYAQDGRLLARFDPASPAHRQGESPHVLDRHLTAGEKAPVPAIALAVAEAVTGVRLDGAWLAAARRVVFLTPLPSELIPEGHADHPALAALELREILDDPRVEHLPRLTFLGADLVTRHTGLEKEPLVAEAVATLRRARLPRAGLADGLAGLADRYAARRDDQRTPPDVSRRLFYQRNAIRAVAAALHPDPAEAARQVCWLAGYAVGEDFGDQLLLVVLSRLVDRAAGWR